jgi:hypothetical protein
MRLVIKVFSRALLFPPGLLYSWTVLPDRVFAAQGRIPRAEGRRGMEPRDRVTDLLVETLAVALAQPGEHRLFRSGKLAGLFPNRGAAAVEAAGRALREDLLERVRVETRGKTEIEWVRLTPRGVEFLHRHESPVQALHDLRAILRANQDAVPVWLAGLRAAWTAMEERLTAEVAAHHPRLTLEDFRDGLKRLHQRRALRLRPAGASEEVRRPEFALLDEAGVCYYAVR